MSEVDFLVKLRDASAMVLDACETRLESLAPAEARSKSVSEEIFLNLKYEDQNTEKLGVFQTADPKENDGERFALAFSILKANQATISKRYHALGYVNAYWIFGDRIYRQLLKK